MRTRRMVRLALVVSVVAVFFFALSLTEVRRPRTTRDTTADQTPLQALPSDDRAQTASSRHADWSGPDATEPPSPGSPLISLLAGRAEGPIATPIDRQAAQARALARWAALPAWLRRALHDMQDHAFHPRHVLVKLADGQDDRAREALLARIDAESSSALGVGPSEEMSRWTLATLHEGARVDEALLALAMAGEAVASAEPDWYVGLVRTPNDPSYSQLYGMNNTGQTGGTADADIDAPEAWDLTTGASVVVGVIDTGVDWDHSDLAANAWTNTAEVNGLPGVDDDANGYVDDVRGWDWVNNDNNPDDDHGHGSHVSGTIAGVGNNGVGVVGVCWTARLMPLKFLSAGGSGSISDAILAVRYATRNSARLTSNSWGGGGYAQAMYDAIQEANDAGILFVAAAGNSGSNNDSSPHYPSSYTNANLIAVAATDNSDALAYFSSYGATSVDLGAPGVSIYSCYMGNAYASMSGTSMATPHVSGACALCWSYSPSSTSSQIKNAILSAVDVTSSLTGKCVTNGRLNVNNAVRSLGNLPGTHSISGTVTWNGNPLAGVTVTLSGGASATMTTGSLGTWQFLSLADGSYTVTPSRTNFTFTPASRSVALAGADSAGNDFTAAQTVPLSISGRVTDPNGGVAGVSIALSGAASASTSTDATGNYSFSALLDGSYTVTPSSSSYGLTPSSRAVALTTSAATGVDFTATAMTTYTADPSPDLPIADLSTTTSTLIVPAGAGTVQDVNVYVDITHTWIGDLVVSIASPSGTTVILHNRSGGSTDNLRTWYDTETTPAQSLSAFVGQDASGTWTLTVQDQAAWDTGTLNLWRLQVATSAPAPPPPTGSISGTVTVDGAPRSGVMVTATGPATLTATTDSAGAYAFSGLDSATWIVWASLTGVTFTPASRQIILAQWAIVTDQDFAGSTLTGTRQPVVGLGAGAGGYFDVLGAAPTLYAHEAFVWMPWSAYGSAVGETRVATGDMDGDGRDEIVVGMGRYPNDGGWAAILDDAQANYALVRWIRIAYSRYRPRNGETWPACGDVEGDGLAEVALGTGAAGRYSGFVELFDDMNHASRYMTRISCGRSSYKYANGTVIPAFGDVDGDGRAELLFGYGTYPREGGVVDVRDDKRGRYRLLRRLTVQWSSYNAANGLTQPACADTDGNGKAEIVVGLGTGGNGQFEVFGDSSTSYAHQAWGQVPWSEYNAYDGQTRVAAGDLDDDGRGEIVVGLGPYPANGGWLWFFEDGASGYASTTTARAGWTDYNALNGETRPAIGKVK